MNSAVVTLGSPTGAWVPPTIASHNLETFQSVVDALMSNRLRNPAFAGPSDPQTGIAREWESFCGNFTGVFYQLVPGEGLAGSEAQMVEVTGDWPKRGVIQSRQRIRAGERLEVVFWARVMHGPVRLQIGLVRDGASCEPYALVEVTVGSAIFREYRVEFDVSETDNQAVYFCNVLGRGRVFFHRMEMRPAGGGRLNTQLLNALRDFRIPALRFPGGLITTCYHWKFGTGPAEYRPTHPDPAFKKEIRYDFGTDEYLEFCSAAGITPHITVNMGAATIAEASGWAAYCREWFAARKLEAPKMYWQLGCESYGHWSRDHADPASYIAAVIDLAPAIRAQYPKAMILALGQRACDGFAKDDPKLPWREPLLEKAGDLIDGIVIQNYCIVRRQPDDPAAQHRDVMDQAEWMATVPRDAIADVRRHGKKLIVGMSEWNTWIDANHYDPAGFREPMDIQHGLFAATMLHHFARLAPDFEIANYYHLVEAMGLFQVSGGVVRKTLVADIFSLYREALPGERVELEFESPELGARSRMLDALCLQTRDHAFLFLVNRSMDQPLDVKLANSESFETSEVISAKSPGDCDATRTVGRPEGDTFRLPALSIARLSRSNTAPKSTGEISKIKDGS